MTIFMGDRRERKSKDYNSIFSTIICPRFHEGT